MKSGLSPFCWKSGLTARRILAVAMIGAMIGLSSCTGGSGGGKSTTAAKPDAAMYDPSKRAEIFVINMHPSTLESFLERAGANKIAAISMLAAAHADRIAKGDSDKSMVAVVRGPLKAGTLIIVKHQARELNSATNREWRYPFTIANEAQSTPTVIITGIRAVRAVNLELTVFMDARPIAIRNIVAR